MAVPAPSIAVAALQNSTHTFVYEGAIGVAGVSQDLHIDLSAIPLYIREDPAFRSTLVVTVKALDSNLTLVSPATLQNSDFHTADTLYDYVTVKVTSDLTSRQALVMVQSLHSATR